jgi:UDP-3-O-[3-hydroxymyristoyl] glucosamine N-acyltransferase
VDYRLDELAGWVGGAVRGDPARRIRGVAPLDQAGPDELSFLTNPRYRQAAGSTAAGAILVAPGSGLERPDLLEVAEPYLALARLLGRIHPPVRPRPGLSPDARVAPGVAVGHDVHVGPFAVVEAAAVLGDRVVVGAGCVIGEGCRLGEDTELRPGVVLYPGTRLGDRCLLHAGVVLGADGFGFATSSGRHHKVPQLGTVVVEDDVEIGANSAVDRAMLGETRLGRGSKIDDLVMIGHGVRLGAHALLAGQAGIAGSARLGARAILAGQAGVAGHLELGDDVVVAAKSAVFDDLPAGARVAGVPAVDHRRWRRVQALVRQLPELQRELRRLRARVAALEGRVPGGEGR